MRRNPDPFRIYRLAGSLKSVRSADCIIVTNAGPHSCASQSIVDFFYLSWQLLRSLFMSQEALEPEIADMRLQIAELKAEAARPVMRTRGQTDPERYLFAIVFCFAFAAGEYWRITGGCVRNLFPSFSSASPADSRHHG